jgi:hypothetical protein
MKSVRRTSADEAYDNTYAESLFSLYKAELLEA